MENTGRLELQVTFIYAKNKREDKRPLWTALPLLDSSNSRVPWIVLGDFNEIRAPEERIDTGTYNHGGPAEFIQATTRLAHLLEMPSVGGDFTWTNNSIGPRHKQSKLDRTFTNIHWIDAWPIARLEFFSGASDHNGMLVTISQTERGRKSFRLFNSRLEDPDFLTIARSGLSNKV